METNQPEDETEQATDTETEGMLDRSKLDFDPADNYFSGTVVDGTSEIPGPHAFDDEEAKEES
jgi:hypothetical protein